MRLNAPKKNVWYICLVVAIISLVIWLLPVLGIYVVPYGGYISFFGMTFSYVLLMLATYLKGL